MNKLKITGAILALLLLTVGIGAGVYFGVNRNQDVRSKATGLASLITSRPQALVDSACIQLWPSPLYPKHDRPNDTIVEPPVSLTPTFKWEHRSCDGRIDGQGCGAFNAWIEISTCDPVNQDPPLTTPNGYCSDQTHLAATPTNCTIIATCIAGLSSSRVTEMDFSKCNIASLEANKEYWWRVYGEAAPAGQTPGWHYRPEDMWRFKTASLSPPPPPPPTLDCTSLTTSADLNNLQIGQLYTFQLTVAGDSVGSIAAPAYYDNNCSTIENASAPLRANGAGTYTVSWRPTRAGPVTVFGEVNGSTARCRADCAGDLPLCSHASACKLSGTVKSSGGPTCDIVTMSPTSTSITGGSETRNFAAQGTAVGALQYDWTATGGTLSSVTGQMVTWTAPANLGTVAQTWTISATAKDASGRVSPAGNCTKTLTFTPAPPSPLAACQKVTASKDLDKIKIGDTVTFTGYGTITNPAAGDSIDKINFIIMKNGVIASDTEVNTTLDSAGVWKATKDFSVTTAGSYSVRIRVHRVSTNTWLE